MQTLDLGSKQNKTRKILYLAPVRPFKVYFLILKKADFLNHLYCGQAILSLFSLSPLESLPIRHSDPPGDPSLPPVPYAATKDYVCGGEDLQTNSSVISICMVFCILGAGWSLL